MTQARVPLVRLEEGFTDQKGRVTAGAETEGTGLRKAHFTLRLIWKRDLDEIIGVVACSHKFLD